MIYMSQKNASKPKPVKTSFSIVSYVENIKNLFSKNYNTSGNDIIYWGEDNQLPADLYEQYCKNVYVGSIINTTLDYIMGGGIELSAEMDRHIKNKMVRSLKESVRISNQKHYNRVMDAVNTKYDSLEDLVRKSVKDKLIFGNYALDSYFTVTGDLTELEYEDMSKVRFTESKTSVKIADRGWSNYSGIGDIRTRPLFTPYQYNSPSVFIPCIDDRTIYPLPYYFSSAEAIAVDSEICVYNLNTLKNSFSPFLMIKVPSMGDGKLEEISNELKKKGTGARGLKYILIEDNGSGVNVGIDSIPQEKLGDRFSILDSSNEKRIFIGFGMPKQLIGGLAESTGFNDQDYFPAYKLYFDAKIYPFREQLIDEIGYLFGIDKPFQFKQSKLELQAFKSNATLTDTIDE